MKKNIKSKVRRPVFKCRFSILIVLFCLAIPTGSNGQHTEHKFEKEISLSDEGRVRINGPESVRITGNGRIYSRQVGDEYIVSRKGETPPIYKIQKKIVINTWRKRSIKQVTKISFRCKTPEQEEQLIKALSLDLNENAAGVVEIDYELNIDKFQVENGWFREENNHILLEDGKDLPVQYLGISTELFLPINSQLSINSEDNEIMIDNLEGQLKLNMVGGSFSGTDVHDISGEVKFAKINVKKISDASLSMQNSSITADSITFLKLESTISKVDVKHVGNLDVLKSVNDKFKFDEVRTLKVTNAVFSTFGLESCTESIEMILKNGDVEIKNLGPSLKFASLINQNAKMSIGINRLESYSLAISSFNKSKYSLPDNLVLTKSEGQDKTYKLGKHSEGVKIEIDCTFCDVVITKSSQ